jgi:hypothetical protein
MGFVPGKHFAQPNTCKLEAGAHPSGRPNSNRAIGKPLAWHHNTQRKDTGHDDTKYSGLAAF